MSTTTPHAGDAEIIAEIEDAYPEFTAMIVVSNKPNLTKSYSLDENNEIKKSPLGNVSSGYFHKYNATLEKLNRAICDGKVEPNHALVHGVCGYDEIEITTQKNPRDGAIPRTKENFRYGPNALLLFDHDHDERGRNLSFREHEAFLNVLEDIDPQLGDVSFFVKSSASAGVRREEEEIDNQTGGFHAYAVVKDGSDIKRYAEAMAKRLIMGGDGFCFISASGSRQIRTIFDQMVHSPERLDYIAPAVVGEGLVIEQPEPALYPGGYIDTHLLTDLTSEEEVQYQRVCRELMDGAEDDAEAIREAYLGVRSTTTGISVEKLRKQYQQGEKGEIDYEQTLFKNDGTPFSFQDAIDNPKAFHGLSTRDPFEPEYGEDKAKLYLNPNGRVVVHSYCHGETSYQVVRNGVPVLLDHNRNLIPPMMNQALWSKHNRPLTDTGNAERFVDLADGNCVYIPSLKKSALYRDKSWGYVPESLMKQATKTVVRSIQSEAAACNDVDVQNVLLLWGTRSESRGARANMLELAKDDLAIDFSEVDSSPDWVGCGNGVIDLKKQELLEANRDRLILSKMGAEFHPDAKCPRFERFIDEIVGGDQDLGLYIQDVFGMILLGRNSEQIMLMLVGAGSNGKSLLLETMQKVFGDYAVTAEPELFLKRVSGNPGQPRADIVELARKRLCITTEPPQGVGLNENLVKRLTGNDTMYARVPYAKEGVTFTPNLVPVMASNHDVRISGTDHGIWRRIKQIQFGTTFEPNREKNLDETLLSERDGILNWLLQGVKRYLRDGLVEPRAVSDNNRRYRTSQDVISEWMGDCCLIGQGDEKQKAVYASYSSWCKCNGYRPLVSRELTSDLKGRGYPTDRKRNGRPVIGIRIKPE